ncbi:NHL repeat-containing protein 2-like [Saccoglossus kowalevskii]|uniref:NHL repeat-containing protein 2-like n=1 Tax=Saccoglossus kowalevskii TaxID=10224 RepID=A0ABM0LXS6_SACKO|nr:PREDICTED: NHL repeat-containing protein 2-like [Saccoglossus kowalevskii]
MAWDRMGFTEFAALFLILNYQWTSFVMATAGVVTTVAGGGDIHTGKTNTDCTETRSGSQDSVGKLARFHYPWGIAFDPLERVAYVADCGCPGTKRTDDRIRKVDVKTGIVTTLAGSLQGYQDGVGEKAMFHHPAGMSMHRKTRTLFVADSANSRIRAINVVTGEVTTFAGSGKEELKDGLKTIASFFNPQAVAVDHVYKDRFFVADTDNHAIREVSLPDGEVTTIAGGEKGFKDGKGTGATFYHPAGVTIDPIRNILFIADHYNHAIRMIGVESKIVTTLAGSGKPGFVNGMGNQAMFNYPEGMAYDTENKVLYVVEFDNNCVRIVDDEGEVRSFVGGREGKSDGLGEEAKFFHPTGLTFDEKEKIIYITDQYNHQIRGISGIGAKTSPPGKITIEKIMTSVKEGYTGTAMMSLTFILFFAMVFVCICRGRTRRFMGKI